MKIILIRHAQTTIEPEKYNPLWSLSDKGITGAQQLANSQLLQGMEVMYTSDQLKALHTGIIIASKLGVFVKQRADLTELTSLTNDWKADYGGFVNDIYSGVIERHGDGESLTEATQRFNQAVAEIVVMEADKQLIGIVAHGNVLALFAAQFEQRDALTIHQAITMPDIAVFDWESKTFDVQFGHYEPSN